MSMDPVSEVLDLPIADRLRAVQAIWDSLAAQPNEVPITATQRREVEEALREYSEAPQDVIPFDEARRRLRSRD